MSALAFTGGAAVAGPVAQGIPDRWVRRRVGTIWSLLFFNVLTPSQIKTIIPYPPRVPQALSAASLGIALVLALSLNRRLQIRPNLILGLATLLLAMAFVADAQAMAGLGSVYRVFRLTAFLAVLWLLTPWWGRRDMLLARSHLRALIAVSSTAIIGLVVSPALALSWPVARLTGVIWPTPPTQVAEYAVIATGMVILLWLSGGMSHRRALPLVCAGIAILLLTQTRTALFGLVAGVVVASASLFLTHRRVRRAMTVTLVVALLVIVPLAPTVATFLTRGQSTAELNDLTGRTKTWQGLLAAPRSGANLWIGFGLSNKSFGGLEIDNTWLAVYQEQGLIGDGVVAAMLLYVLIVPAFRRASPARALAIFLGVYCAFATYTEVGLGDASSYLLHIVVAASLLAPSVEEHDPSSLEQAA